MIESMTIPSKSFLMTLLLRIRDESSIKCTLLLPFQRRNRLFVAPLRDKTTLVSGFSKKGRGMWRRHRCRTVGTITTQRLRRRRRRRQRRRQRRRRRRQMHDNVATYSCEIDAHHPPPSFINVGTFPTIIFPRLVPRDLISFIGTLRSFRWSLGTPFSDRSTSELAWIEWKSISSIE